MHTFIRFSFITILFSTLLFGEAPKITSPMTMQELNSLSAFDSAAGDKFGISVAISSDTAIVGAYLDDCVDGSDCGSATIFERNPATGLFEQRAKLTASDALAVDRFGVSVAIDGDTVVVGAYADDNIETDAGSAYLFEKPLSGIWEDANESAKLTASDGDTGDYFGVSVAIDIDTVIVGAYKSDNIIIDSGSAYLFEKPLSGIWIDANESAKLSASDGALDDGFGYSVSISGETVVVGAYGDGNVTDDDIGSAYLFEKPGEVWVDANQSAKLTASDGGREDRFGYSVAISGTTVIVGAYLDDNMGGGSGSAYIFEKPAGDWISTNENAILTAFDGEASDNFGYSVAISGDTAIVGAWYSNSPESNSGSAYLFNKPASGDWTDASQSVKLTASDASSEDLFGFSVAVSGETVIVGASEDDIAGTDSGSAYIFKNAITENSVENKSDILDIEATDIDGDNISFEIIGGEDAVYFDINDTSGLLSFIAAPDFETPLDDNGDNIYEVMLKISDDSSEIESDTYKSIIKVSNLEYEGDAPEAITFKELNKLTSSDADTDDKFGYSVAISGSIAVVGMYGDEVNTGSAYIYEYQSASNTFVQQARLSASDGAVDDYFGYSVAISGDTVVVGVYGDDGGTYDYRGSAYVFEKPAEGWNDVNSSVILTASDGVENDHFGYSVAISDDTIVVGAYNDDDTGTDSGSAYLFEKPEGAWVSATQSVKLTASDGAASDKFGISVAISGDSVIVGAEGDNTYSGSAYLFEKPAGNWVTATESAKLTASDGESWDYFGHSVAISGDTIVVGANEADDIFADSGSAYLFEKPSTGWINATESAKLTASDAATEDLFGISIAISGDTVIVGAFMDDDTGSNSGSAYLFEKPDAGWSSSTESAKLTASDGALGDNFGYSVSISGDTAIVGAYMDDCSDDSLDCGSATIFKVKESGISPAIIMYLLN